MSKKLLNPSRSLSFFGALTLSIGFLQAADLTWDTSTGNWSWDTVTANWIDSGSASSAWINDSTANFNDATGGIITISSGITTSGVTIAAGVWEFAGATLGGTNGLNIANGTELTLNGAGMTYTGDTTVDGILKLGASSSTGLAFR
ncbi:MAG: hypothetical protein LBV12_07640, partial [Puniceicoccales bacterium]|nr:hypothetical protein [Puniceicoccales bacterium]